jgi:hypothetical protein
MENILRGRGRGRNYKFDRGGQPTEFGPYIGVVKNNIDPTRSGRLQVYIEQFGGDNPNDSSLWRTVSYVPPFYGVTPLNNSSSSSGPGSFKGNQQSYGMWFTPPDLNVQVICFFIAGDPNQGYYIGCVPDPGITHMIPAVGASKKFDVENQTQQQYITAADAKQVPVTEVNSQNDSVMENPRFFDTIKPVHSYVAGILLNQGLISDYIRGPISSSSQRESPSAVFGMSTPGRAIYQGGLKESDIKAKLDAGSIKLADLKVEGRRGGHSFVMDDGDLRGRDNLIRIRTAKGHQITMSDEADCFYFIHANGQTWIEMGSEGTVDVYSANSVNVRSQGQINLHADQDININSKQNINIKSKNFNLEAEANVAISGTNNLTLYSKSLIGVRSDGTLSLQGTGGWNSSGALSFKGSPINLNSGSAPDPVTKPNAIVSYTLDDTKFNPSAGWEVIKDSLETIVPRAPTHEPYPYHNRGVPVQVDYAEGATAEPSAKVNDAIDSTKDVQLQTQVDTADVLSEEPATANIGSLDKAEVTGLLAQTANEVNQDPSTISIDKGIGKYGLTPTQLEASGYLKPGTVSQLNTLPPQKPTAADVAEATRINTQGGNTTPQKVAQQRKINSMLASPQLWTGQSGVNSLPALLSNPGLQSTVQQGLMTTALAGLKTSGLATGTEAVKTLGPLVSAATKFGISDTQKWVNGAAPAAIATAIAATVRGSQFSVDFVGKKISDLLGTSKVAPSVVNTIARGSVDSAVKSLLGDAKIPDIQFKPVARTDDASPPSAAAETSATDAVNKWIAFNDTITSKVEQVYAQASALEGRSAISQSAWETVYSAYQSILSTYNAEIGAYQNRAQSLVNSAPADVQGRLTVLYQAGVRDSNLLRRQLISLGRLLNDLKAFITV